MEVLITAFTFFSSVSYGEDEHNDRSKKDLPKKRGDQANFSISVVLPQSTAGCLPWRLWECIRHLCLEIVWREKRGKFPVVTKGKSLK